jgi:hypothetical protein
MQETAIVALVNMVAVLVGIVNFTGSAAIKDVRND